MVNPPLLVWAREQSGYGLEPVAKRLNVKPERLQAWEHGERKPTVRQAQNLARFYQRPFGLFFLPQPPSIAPLASEYRRLPGVKPGEESPELRLALRVLSHRREVALELADNLGAPFPEFAESVRLTESPTEAGARLRAGLGVTVEEQRAWRNEWQAWRRWREAIESAGVLVCQFPKVPFGQARGVALLDFPVPVIGINSKEQSPGARAFTLLHELTHVALARGQQERVALREHRSEADWEDVERFAEETASAVLIPGDNLREVIQRMAAQSDAWDVPMVRRLARAFRVTPLAMATRLRAEGLLTWDAYGRWKAQWADYVAALPPRRSGFASPVDRTLSRGGRPFVRLVLEAMDRNHITSVDACRYLDLGFHHVEKLRAELRGGPGRGTEAAEAD